MGVTQLTVGDAMKRIKVWESEEVVSLRGEQEEARVRLTSMSAADLADALELARLREHVAELRKRPVANERDTASVSADVARRRMQVRKLEKSIGEKREQLGNLQILLSELEGRAEREGIALRLPDPRPAPLATEELAIFCRYGRVFEPRLDALKRELAEVIQTAPRPVPRYFEAYDVGNELLRWRVIDEATRRVHRLEWRNTGIGETLDELSSPDAALRRALASHDPKSRFVHFYVWEDSFEIYLEARRLAEELGFAAGWEALSVGRPLDFVQRAPSPTPVD
jgi:hypothetical protein